MVGVVRAGIVRVPLPSDAEVITVFSSSRLFNCRGLAAALSELRRGLSKFVPLVQF